jgi:uncharacterized membrane protein
MGIYDQGVWLLSRFHAPFVTVMGRNLFGDHTSFVLLLAVPLYWVWPEAQSLLVLQTLLLAAAAVPVYLLALRRTASIVIATALAGAYLLNPALQNGNLEQFHPESFLVLSTALAIYAAVERKPRLLAVSVVVSLMVKQDVGPLMMLPLGVWVYFRRDQAWGLKICVAAIAWIVFAYAVVIALLLGSVSFYANRVPFGGFGGLLSTLVAHPVKFWRYFRSAGRLYYLWQLGISFGFAFVAGLDIALIGVLVLLENVLSTFPYMHIILYHYDLELVPVLALATVIAISRFPGATRYAMTLVATAAAFWACVLWGLAPFSRHQYPHASPNGAYALGVNSVLRNVPPNAVVSAHYEFVSHLDHRTQIYQWPTPFSASYWGLYTQEGQRLPFADQVQYVVLPDGISGLDASVWASISGQFVAIGHGGGVTVYRRV